MQTVPFNRSHCESFLRCAKAEGWITDQRELEFLLAAYPEGCLVSLDNDDCPAGFITSVRYSKSAWIGNLLVLPEHRCQGVGRDLIQRVLDGLDLSGCETVWLTASADGAHLYRTLGFWQIDTVRRWRGFGVAPVRGMRCTYSSAVATVDGMGWGDDRRLIFDSLPKNCCSVANHDGFMVRTPCDDGMHIGPWGAVSRDAAAAFLGAALADGIGGEVFLDSPERNRAAEELLLSNGFRVTGSTLLMYRGKTPEYRPEYVFSLASMGSYG
jgi:GNAT superfamily N-acetyltransferase